MDLNLDRLYVPVGLGIKERAHDLDIISSLNFMNYFILILCYVVGKALFVPDLVQQSCV